MPKFELKSSVYGDIKPGDLKGKVVLVSLFATWCGPCQKELAEVQSTLWPKYKDNKDFVMLVIGREHTDAELQKYNERKKFTFPLYPDPKREVFSKFAEDTSGVFKNVRLIGAEFQLYKIENGTHISMPFWI